MDKNNLSIVRQSFANTVFTHKVHEVAVEKQEKKMLIIKKINISLVAIVLIILLIQTARPADIILSYIASGLTLAEIILLITQLNFNFEQGIIMHKDSALKYMQLRDKYRCLIVDIMNQVILPETLTSRRDLLQSEYQVISDLSPQTSKKEYDEVQKRLNKKGVVEGEQFTWSDEEINQFLPETLRITNK